MGLTPVDPGITALLSAGSELTSQAAKLPPEREKVCFISTQTETNVFVYHGNDAICNYPTQQCFYC